MMLVWARGISFARLNGLPCVTSSWWGLHWGALLRREKKNRLYAGYFTETPLQKQYGTALLSKVKTVVKNPSVNKLLAGVENDKIYLFDTVITDNDLFGELRQHEALVREALDQMLTTKMKTILKSRPAPAIGVHIRRGDFKLGNQTTPLQYFISLIKIIRDAAGCVVPVTIFTDADNDELLDLLKLPKILMAEKNPDIIDILLLSKSKLMILSRSSTFGYWAAFLSSSIVVRPKNDWQPLIKNDNAATGYCEIKWDAGDYTSTIDLSQKIDSCKQLFN